MVVTVRYLNDRRAVKDAHLGRDTSSATGIMGGSALLMVDYLQWLSDNNTMLRYRRQHKVEHS